MRPKYHDNIYLCHLGPEDQAETPCHFSNAAIKQHTACYDTTTYPGQIIKHTPSGATRFIPVP